MARQTPQRGGSAPPIPEAATTALFVDLDGTLIDFAATPDAIAVDARLPTLLRSLRSALNGALAIISGRPLNAIDALLPSLRLPAAGQHGAEMRHVDGRVQGASIAPADLDAARVVLHTRPAHAADVRVEDKQIALAIHYREFPGAEPFARELAAAALRAAGSGFELQHGDFVIELKSSQVDKGRALAALMSSPPFAGRTPWMLGDDYADEHAFAMAQALGGAGVVVNSRFDSIAHYALADTRAARTWLARIVRQHRAAA